jgi:hypothetical protein
VNALSLAIVAVQVFDIVIHVATNQAEPIRITANLLLIAWAGLIDTDRFRSQLQRSGALLVAAYVVLNLVFLFQEGFTNPNQGGEPRLMMLILVALSTALSAVLLSRKRLVARQ